MLATVGERVFGRFRAVSAICGRCAGHAAGTRGSPRVGVIGRRYMQDGISAAEEQWHVLGFLGQFSVHHAAGTALALEEHVDSNPTHDVPRRRIGGILETDGDTSISIAPDAAGFGPG